MAVPLSRSLTRVVTPAQCKKCVEKFEGVAAIEAVNTNLGLL